MSYAFYQSAEYRKKQSLITKKKWESGHFNFRYRRISRKCLRKECNEIFTVIPSDSKTYCSNACAAIINNRKRGSRSEATKLKISRTLTGRQNPHRGVRRVSRVELICANPSCQRTFLRERWMHRKYCSNACTMAVVGSQPTSPRAARAKAGIREDLGDYYFYSRWEANIARLFNFFKIKWVHQPASFDLESQKYTPDFYLPEYDKYIEVKNFMGEYSKIRDEKFRKLYPNIKLELILKDNYLKLEQAYAQFIKNWEYRNSWFEE